jgi:predicted DNA-binding protein (MmcQ/YjbR family)
MSTAAEIHRWVREHALGLPGAYEDFPWDESVVKVAKKVFVFLGAGEAAETPGCSVKLRESHDQAMTVPGVAPMGYGLGRAGWIYLPFGDDAPPVEVLGDWVEESYRLVAPKRLVAELDRRMAG